MVNRILIALPYGVINEEYWRECIKKQVNKVIKNQAISDIKYRNVEAHDKNSYDFPPSDAMVIEMIVNHNSNPLTRNTFEVKSKELLFLK